MKCECPILRGALMDYCGRSASAGPSIEKEEADVTTLSRWQQRVAVYYGMAAVHFT